MSDNNHISSEIIQHICESLSKNEALNEVLPKNGFLHIDKLLPFICIYRFKKTDVYFSRLLKTQASYLIVDETIDISKLLDALNKLVVNKYETFLMLEFWPNDSDHDKEFKIFCPKDKSPETVKALKEGFDSLNKTTSSFTTIVDTFERHPKHLDALLNLSQSKKSGVLIIGVSIPKLYIDHTTHELYTLYFRTFYSVFSETVKRAVYEFIRVQTSDPFENYLMLGKTHIDDITLQADRELADISEKMSFLLRITPVNSNEEWDKFYDSNFKTEPKFAYRLITIDPELAKRRLYNIPIDQVDDPTMAFILRGKRLEIEKQLTMLEERGTANFRFIGESLYGIINKDLLQTSQRILNLFPENETIKSAKRYNCNEFAEQAQIEISHYNSKFPELDLSLEIRDDLTGLMVSKSKLLINTELSIDAKRADALIQHEVSTHILTYCNGKNQPFRQMHEGFAGYDQLQEGLAVIAEYLVGGLTVNRLRLLAGRVIAVQSMLNDADFITTFNLMHKNYCFTERTAYTMTMRVYRGGGLTKDASYLAGLIDLMAYLKNGGKLETLYTGKFNVTHIGLIEELLYRKVLRPPELPRFLERESVQLRLKQLREGISITELIN